MVKHFYSFFISIYWSWKKNCCTDKHGGSWFKCLWSSYETSACWRWSERRLVKLKWPAVTHTRHLTWQEWTHTNTHSVAAGWTHAGPDTEATGHVLNQDLVRDKRPTREGRRSYAKDKGRSEESDRCQQSPPPPTPPSGRQWRSTSVLAEGQEFNSDRPRLSWLWSENTIWKKNFSKQAVCRLGVVLTCCSVWNHFKGDSWRYESLLLFPLSNSCSLNVSLLGVHECLTSSI